MASYTCIKLQKSTKQSTIQQYGWRQKLNNLFEPNETNSIDNSHNEYYYWQSTLNVFKEYEIYGTDSNAEIAMKQLNLHFDLILKVTL